jgi:hypothetical protein
MAARAARVVSYAAGHVTEERREVGAEGADRLI